MNRRDNACPSVAQWPWRCDEKTDDARYPSAPSAGREFHFYMVVYFAAVTRLSDFDQRAMAFYY